MKWISTTENEKWSKLNTFSKEKGEELKISDPIGKEIYGFGACFNEIGMKAIASLSKARQNEIYDDLFSEDGLNFCYNRIPVAANDFAEDWYSYNDTKGDYEMKNFSINRDKEYIIPAIKQAQKRCPDMDFFASPWSPPTWMKYPQACNYGRLVQTEENLKAYALYLRKFTEEYAKEGIKISHLHPQNEFLCDHKVPSCQYNADEMENFIANYLIDEIGDLCEIWLGTNCWRDNYTPIYNTIMQNEKIRKNIKGAGFQWSAPRKYSYSARITLIKTPFTPNVNAAMVKTLGNTLCMFLNFTDVQAKAVQEQMFIGIWCLTRVAYLLGVGIRIRCLS